jgi:hypothetical protein
MTRESIAKPLRSTKKVPLGDSSYYQALYEMGLSQMQDSQFVAALATVGKGLRKPNDRWPEFYALKGNLTDDMGDPEKIRLSGFILRTLNYTSIKGPPCSNWNDMQKRKPCLNRGC